jgi:periplasmic copper chaperone A
MSDSRLAARSLALSLTCLVMFASPVGAARDRGCQPQLQEGWVGLPPGRAVMVAGFGRIENRCDAAASIVAASSTGFGSVELHRSRTVEGVSRMRAVPRLELAPRGEVRLSPGGLHLMLMHPRAPLRVGERVKVTFELADGRAVHAELDVRPLLPSAP